MSALDTLGSALGTIVLVFVLAYWARRSRNKARARRGTTPTARFEILDSRRDARVAAGLGAPADTFYEDDPRSGVRAVHEVSTPGPYNADARRPVNEASVWESGEAD